MSRGKTVTRQEEKSHQPPLFVLLPYRVQLVVLVMVGWVTRYQQELLEFVLAENEVCKQQLAASGQRLRLSDVQRRRLAELGKKLGPDALRKVSTLVTPGTILRWYRELVERKYTAKPRGNPGRPRTSERVVEVVLRFATENPTWGYTKIRDMVRGQALDVSRSTVRRIVKAHGLEPAPQRGKETSWRAFLAAHWGAVAAADFFCVEVLTRSGLVRYQVLFFMDLATRRVHIAGVAPDGSRGVEWMKQIARNVTDCVDGFLKDTHVLIVDRDPQYSPAFRHLLQSSGVEVVQLPPKSPNLNAYAERFVRSIKSECLDHVIPLGESHLRWLLREYVAHYHSERYHQGLESRLIQPDERASRTSGPIVRTSRVGGLLNYYHRAAA